MRRQCDQPFSQNKCALAAGGFHKPFLRQRVQMPIERCRFRAFVAPRNVLCDLCIAGGKIKSAIRTRIDHAFELLSHSVRPKVRHRNEHALLFRIVVSHLGGNPAANHITGARPVVHAVHHQCTAAAHAHTTSDAIA